MTPVLGGACTYYWSSDGYYQLIDYAGQMVQTAWLAEFSSGAITYSLPTQEHLAR